MNIQAITPEYNEAASKIIKEQWGLPIVSRGKQHDATKLPGFISFLGSKINGVVTYNIENGECEIVTLNSLEENKGIGTGLINAVLAAANEKNCDRIWLVTTNDNINALRFYQKRGFDMTALHRNAMDAVRELKPTVPLIGENNIPLKHEIEFEIIL